MVRLSRPDPDDPTFRECVVLMDRADVPLSETQPFLEELSMGYNCILDIIVEHVSDGLGCGYESNNTSFRLPKYP